jgi:hypothetical protein
VIKSVGDEPIFSLLSPDHKVVYQVPQYQREYSWSRQHWDDLFDDLLEADVSGSGHFLGTIICVNRTRNTTQENVLELVDGQQRMTTLSILLAAIHQFLAERSDKLDENGTTDLSTLRRQLVLKSSYRPRVRPQRQNSNYDDYLNVLSLSGFDVKAPKVKFLGNRRIMKAYTHFRSRIADHAGPRSSIKPVLGLLERVKRAVLVKLEVESNSDAFTLFESLNNRGMPLTPIDLIKNSLLSAADKSRDKEFTAERVFERWSALLADLGDDYSKQERFFRHYYNAFKDELPSVPKAPVATRSKLIKIYERLISQDLESLLPDIVACGDVYKRIVGNLDDDEPRTSFDDALADLARAQGAPSEVLLLYLMTYRADLKLTEKMLESITRNLISFFVRRNLTSVPPTNMLQRLFMSIITDVTDLTGTQIVGEVRARLRDATSDDATFRAKLIGPVYDENADVTRFILVSLAQYSMSHKETFINLWEREGNHYKWSIEHILPQGPRLPKEWITMLGGTETATAIQQQHAHRLGNLTITGYNSTLGNRSFDYKKKRKDGKGNYIGFKNGFALNADVAAATTWTDAQISQRSEKLVKQALKIFAL